MAKGKYEEWLTEDGLLRLAAWARDGLTDDQICDKDHMGIARSTLYEWRKKYAEISNALKKNKELADIEVENALRKAALGYTVKLKKTFKVKVVRYNEETGRKIAEAEKLVEGVDEIHIPANVTAQIYWLNNRKPDQWRNKPKGEADANSIEDLRPLAALLCGKGAEAAEAKGGGDNAPA